MSKITYADKEYIYENASIPEINKITDGNMNEIKSVVNGLDSEVSTGWISANETWTYSSVDDPTGVITISGDKTTKYSLGMRIKFTNGGNVIYGIITAISYSSPNTTLTFLHEINTTTGNTALYLMTNSAITNNYYSSMKVPYKFPTNPSKWSVSFTGAPNLTTENPVNGTLYNQTSDVVNLPTGAWKVEYKCTPNGYMISGTSLYSVYSWSTSKTKETLPESTFVLVSEGPTGLKSNASTFACNIVTPIVLSSKTPYYFIYNTLTTGVNSIGRGTLFLTATCAYL